MRAYAKISLIQNKLVGGSDRRGMKAKLRNWQNGEDQDLTEDRLGRKNSDQSYVSSGGGAQGSRSDVNLQDEDEFGVGHSDDTSRL